MIGVVLNDCSMWRDFMSQVDGEGANGINWEIGHHVHHSDADDDLKGNNDCKRVFNAFELKINQSNCTGNQNNA